MIDSEMTQYYRIYKALQIPHGDHGNSSTVK